MSGSLRCLALGLALPLIPSAGEAGTIFVNAAAAGANDGDDGSHDPVRPEKWCRCLRRVRGNRAALLQ
ncbi:MAG TPA: hypothetical protein VKE50_05875 [Thermoanaerobaculia bacterium]|nr:hypothetical protein [Thermoanaerobaculia bacterium]